MIVLQFLYEKDLKNKFWEFYKNRKSIVKHQFESDARDGGIDLLTIEKYQDEYQICAFEFKLSDIKKALAQAEANLPFVSKSFIVIPAEKEQLIQDKYLSYLKEKHYIGVIGVEQGGRWRMIYQPLQQRKVLMNQQILKFVMKGY